MANNTAIIERIIGKNDITDWKAFDANSIPEISPILVFSKTPENTIAKDVNKQRIPVKKVSRSATKPCEMCSFVCAAAYTIAAAPVPASFD